MSTALKSAVSDKSFRMGRTMPNRGTARYPKPTDLLDSATAEFRVVVLGLGQRLPLKGKADMLAGKRTTPHEYAVQFVTALRGAGLTRADAERWVLWNQALVAQVYGGDHTPIDVLEEREQAAESEADMAYLRFKNQPTRENRMRLCEARMAEAAAELAILAHPEARDS